MNYESDSAKFECNCHLLKIYLRYQEEEDKMSLDSDMEYSDEEDEEDRRLEEQRRKEKEKRKV